MMINLPQYADHVSGNTGQHTVISKRQSKIFFSLLGGLISQLESGSIVIWWPLLKSRAFNIFAPSV